MEGSDLPDKEFKLIVKDAHEVRRTMREQSENFNKATENISKQITEFKNTVAD